MILVYQKFAFYEHNYAAKTRWIVSKCSTDIQSNPPIIRVVSLSLAAALNTGTRILNDLKIMTLKYIKKKKNETCRGQLLPHHGEWTIECPFFRRITSDAHDSPKWGVLRIPHDGHRRKDVLQYRNPPTCACLVPSKKKDDAPLIFNGPKTCCQHPPLSNSTIIQFIIMGDLFSVFCEHTNLSFLKKDLLWWAGCLQHTRQ